MDTPEKPFNIGDFITRLARDGHSSHAIWGAATLEHQIAHVLRLSMPNLSNNLHDKLFAGYGPLSSFSAKIDVAYAMGHISATIRRDLHVFRDIRNEFAHPNSYLHFDTDELHKLLKKFSDYDPKKDRLAFYFDKLRTCMEEIGEEIRKLDLVNALRQRVQAKPQASREKSAKRSHRRQPRSRDGNDKGGGRTV